VYPLDKELHNGDIIEIVIDKNKSPNPFRLSFVKTTKAKDKIKNHMKKYDKDQNRDRGKEILNKYLKNASLPILDKDLLILKNLDGRELSTDERGLLLEQIGNFSLSPSALIRRILRSQNIKTSSKREKPSYNPEKKKEKITFKDKEIIIG